MNVVSTTFFRIGILKIIRSKMGLLQFFEIIAAPKLVYNLTFKCIKIKKEAPVIESWSKYKPEQTVVDTVTSCKQTLVPT